MKVRYLIRDEESKYKSNVKKARETVEGTNAMLAELHGVVEAARQADLPHKMLGHWIQKATPQLRPPLSWATGLSPSGQSKQDLKVSMYH